MKLHERFFVYELEMGILWIDSEGRIFHGSKRAESKNNGYWMLNRRVDNKLIRAYSHRVIWIFRNGDIPDGLEINHKDGNRSNNKLSNLEIITHAQNTTHAYQNGLAHGRPGEKHHNARLTQLQVKQIRKLYRPRDGQSHPMTNEPRYSQSGLARMFGVSQTQIGRIIRFARWK